MLACSKRLIYIMMSIIEIYIQSQPKKLSYFQDQHCEDTKIGFKTGVFKLANMTTKFE